MTKEEENMEKLLTVKEVSEMLCAKPATVYAWAEQGMIPHLKLNGLLRFLEDDIGNVKYFVSA